MPFCPYCGAEMKEDYAYCRNCGKKIESASKTTQTPPLIQPAENARQVEWITELDVWKPIILLIALFVSGFLFGLLGGGLLLVASARASLV